MKTETLLNIRPEVPRGDDSSAKQALLQDPGTVAEADSFKSKLMHHIGQQKSEQAETEKKSEKNLPHDGKVLPNKENVTNQADTPIVAETIEERIANSKLLTPSHVELPIVSEQLPQQARIEGPVIVEQQSEQVRVEGPVIVEQQSEQVRVEGPVIVEQQSEQSEQARVEGPAIVEQQSEQARIEGPVFSEELPEQARAERPILSEQQPEQAKIDRPAIVEQQSEQVRVERPIFSEELPEQARAERPILSEQQPGQVREEHNKKKAIENVSEVKITSEKIIEPTLLAQEVDKAVNPVLLAKVFNEKVQIVKPIPNENGLEKKKVFEASNVQSNAQSNTNQSAMFKPVTSEANLQSGQSFENKNEQSLGKHISEFQQYMESSRKQAQFGEAIGKVKNFDEKMKLSQENLQAMRNELKMSANNSQNPSMNQAAAQTIATERSPLSNSFTLLSSFQPNTQANAQSFAAMEVKTGVGKPGWNQGFSNQIVMMAKNGIQQAKIKLNPAHLGPIEAMVKITGEAAVVNLTSLQMTTKDTMENAIPRLKEMLNENGFSQVDVNVSHQDKQERQGPALSSNKEHGNPTMPGEEQLSDDELDLESDAIAEDSKIEEIGIVDYYA